MAVSAGAEFWGSACSGRVLSLLRTGNAPVIALAVRRDASGCRASSEALGAVGLRLVLVASASLPLRVPLLERLGRAGEMLTEDPLVKRGLGKAAGALHSPVPLVIGLAVTACDRWFARDHRHRVKVPENL